jgi:hypothetical protein
MSADVWLSGCHARRITGLSWYMLHKHVMLGDVRACVEPAGLLRYHRTDCERLGTTRHSPVESASKTRSDVRASPKRETRTVASGRVSMAPCVVHVAGVNTRGTLKAEREFPHVPRES